MPRYWPGEPPVSGGFRTSSFRGVALRPPQLEAEVAVRRPLHHGLGAGQLHRRVEALDQGEVAVTGEQRADLRDAERAVHLGVPAPRDVERELLLALLQHIHAVGVALLPVLQGRGEVAEAVAAPAPGQLLALLARHVDDDPARGLEHLLAAELLAQRGQHRHQDAGLDLAALEHADLVQLVGRHWGAHRGPPWVTPNPWGAP